MSVLNELNPNEEFPNEHELMNASFDSEDSNSPEEVKNKVNELWNGEPVRHKKYIKNFSVVCQIVGPENFLFVIERYYPPNKKLIESRPEVANLLIENLELVFKVMSNNPNFPVNSAARVSIERILVAFLGELLDSNTFNLAVVSRGALVKIGRLLSPSVADSDLLTVILGLLHDPKSESNNTAALELLKKLNDLFSPDNIKGFIAMDIIAMLQSPSVNIRIEATHALFSLFDHFTREFVESRFGPVIEGLTRDPNNTVINNLIKNMPSLAKKVSFNQFEKSFFPKFIEYLNSKNRFQKEEALMVLGQMILALTTSDDESHVFSVYSSLHLEKLLEAYFDLPRVVSKMNLVTKRAIIKTNYELLIDIVKLKKNDIWQRIKRLIIATEEFETVIIEAAKMEVSSRLDAIAKICDKLTLENDLIVLIDKYYLTVGQSTSQAVRQNTIKVLFGVLKELSPEIREKYADVYQTTVDNETNKWRLRYVISEQMEQLITLFKPETVFQKIVPMYSKFCHDNCAVVRKSAARQFGKVFLSVEGHEMSKEYLLVTLKSLGSYNRFVFRQSFVLMAESALLRSPEWEDKEVMDLLLKLASDRVVNVRLAVARLVVELVQAGVKGEFVKAAKEAMLADIDGDLYNLLKPAFLGAEQEKLTAAWKRREGEREAAATAERARVDGVKMSKGLLKAPAKPGQSPVSSTKFTGPTSAQSLQALLTSAFSLAGNPEAKELLEELKIEAPVIATETVRNELASEGQRKEEPVQPVEEPQSVEHRDGQLQQYVDIDIKQLEEAKPGEQIDKAIEDKKTVAVVLENAKQIEEEGVPQTETPALHQESDQAEELKVELNLAEEPTEPPKELLKADQQSDSNPSE